MEKNRSGLEIEDRNLWSRLEGVRAVSGGLAVMDEWCVVASDPKKSSAAGAGIIANCGSWSGQVRSDEQAGIS